MNPLFIDLTRYTEELDIGGGASSSGSTSLLVSIAFKADSSTGLASNNNRTLPYQTADWSSTMLGGLKAMAYISVMDRFELTNGVY